MTLWGTGPALWMPHGARWTDGALPQPVTARRWTTGGAGGRPLPG